MRGCESGKPSTTLLKGGGQKWVGDDWATLKLFMSDHLTLPSSDTYPYRQYHIPGARSVSGLYIGQKVSRSVHAVARCESCE